MVFQWFGDFVEDVTITFFHYIYNILLFGESVCVFCPNQYECYQTYERGD